MATGRKTGGRTKGTPNKRTAEREAKFQAASEAIEAALPETFQGDAHALLMTVYKDPSQEMSLRIDAAKAAIKFEKPALSSVEARVEHSMDSLSEEQLLDVIRDNAAAAGILSH